MSFVEGWSDVLLSFAHLYDRHQDTLTVPKAVVWSGHFCMRLLKVIVLIFIGLLGIGAVIVATAFAVTDTITTDITDGLAKFHVFIVFFVGEGIIAAVLLGSAFYILMVVAAHRFIGKLSDHNTRYYGTVLIQSFTSTFMAILWLLGFTFILLTLVNVMCLYCLPVPRKGLFYYCGASTCLIVLDTVLNHLIWSPLGIPISVYLFHHHRHTD